LSITNSRRSERRQSLALHRRCHRGFLDEPGDAGFKSLLRTAACVAIGVTTTIRIDGANLPISGTTVAAPPSRAG
jgi:hypothetical protein